MDNVKTQSDGYVNPHVVIFEDRSGLQSDILTTKEEEVLELDIFR